MNQIISRRNFLKTTSIALALSNLEVLANQAEDYSYLDVYDDYIKLALQYFRNIHGFAPEINVIKAIIVIESGSEKHRNNAFAKDPMQIANEGDFALDVLSQRREHSYLIGDFSFLSGKIKTPRKNGKLDYSKSNMDSKSSIFGGVGWLYHKAAKYAVRTIEDDVVFQYRVRAGDTLVKISEENETTLETLEKYNPRIKEKKLPVGKNLKVRKARIGVYIPGWREVDEAVQRYNGKKGSDYIAKVREVCSMLNTKTP